MVSGLKTYIGEPEVETLISAAPTLRDRLVIRLLYRLGCRVSELVAIKCSDVDYEQGLILIHHLKRRIKVVCTKCGAKVGRKHNFCPKCGAQLGNQQSSEEVTRQRLIPVDKRTLALIKEYLDKRRTKSNRLIPLTRQRIYYIVQDAAIHAGLGGKILLNPDSGRRKGISPHRFRDAFAIHSLKVDPSITGQVHLQRHLGHASFNTTAKYIKYAPEEDKEWYEKTWGKE